MRKGGMERASRPVPQKHLRASTGDSTIGSPFTLNDVLSTTGTPVSSENRWMMVQ